ncbi:T9SS type A sorting domain-containing protein [Candidatus Latescibacterota bacterium]
MKKLLFAALIAFMAITISVNAQETNSVTLMFESLLGSSVLDNSLEEGQSKEVADVPAPLDYVNGTKIFIPENSLNEDIIITLKIPDVAVVNIFQQTIAFPDSILSALEFEVEADGIVVHPYYFALPIEVTLPYNEALLANMGITTDDIGMYYLTDTGELDENGITDLVIDEENGLIHAKVAHLSDVVIAEKPAVPSSVSENMPIGFSLMANYPNPFNPTTTISFNTAELSNVNVSIYNMLGQHVKTLVNEIKPAGTYSVVWNGRNESGAAVTSGMYLYRFEAGSYSESRKLMLMK